MAVGKLYMTDLSPPCRAVILTAKSLGIELELIETNIMAGETATPEFLKVLLLFIIILEFLECLVMFVVFR